MAERRIATHALEPGIVQHDVVGGQQGIEDQFFPRTKCVASESDPAGKAERAEVFALEVTFQNRESEQG
jgi:hypothetical protein